MDDPYKILGVARDASQDDIRKAYRKLAKKHHPDLNPNNAAAEERFKAAASANALLSDTEKRARFDRGEIDASGAERAPQQPNYRDYAEGGAGRRYSGAAGINPEDLQDIFGNMFGGRGGGGRPGARENLRGQDEHYALTLSFLDAIGGSVQHLTLPDGRSLEVRIPPGADDGRVVRLRGQGGPGWNGGTAGDALIELHVTPHRFFVRDGQDIRLELPISLKEAVLGGKVEVPTPAGPVRMAIPVGADTGQELRLRGRGVPAHGQLPAGDLYARLKVVVGKPDAALQAFLRDWAPVDAVNPRAGLEGGQ